MVALAAPMPPGMSGLVAGATVHGLSDVWEVPPARLLCYVAVLLPPPRAPWASVGTTAAFLAASAVHFSGDVGPWASATLHATAGGLAVWNVAWASTLMGAYYLGVHVARHGGRWWREGRGRAVGALVGGMGAGLLAEAAGALARPLVVGDCAQRLVLVHVLIGVA